MRGVIVTGDRYAKFEHWKSIVDKAIGPGGVVVIQGGANGIDSIAASQCTDDYLRSDIPVMAQWGTQGKGAGPRRNAAMLSILLILKEHGYTVECHAFHDDIEASSGTKDMANRAYRADVPTWIHTTWGEPKRMREVIA